MLAESLARFEARHHAVKRNRMAIEELREVYGDELPDTDEDLGRT